MSGAILIEENKLTAYFIREWNFVFKIVRNHVTIANVVLDMFVNFMFISR